MKTFHVNLQVMDLNESVNFYNKLFGFEATTVKDDYAKWALEDPKVNFSISLSKVKKGLAHLGIEAENEKELMDIYSNFDATESEVDNEGHTVCCYAQSEKSWLTDPQGIEWEAFRTYGSSEINKAASTASSSKCCDDNCCN